MFFKLITTIASLVFTFGIPIGDSKNRALDEHYFFFVQIMMTSANIIVSAINEHKQNAAKMIVK